MFFLVALSVVLDFQCQFPISLCFWIIMFALRMFYPSFLFGCMSGFSFWKLLAAIDCTCYAFDSNLLIMLHFGWFEFHDFSIVQNALHRRLWAPVRHLESIHPYANPRGNYVGEICFCVLIYYYKVRNIMQKDLRVLLFLWSSNLTSKEVLHMISFIFVTHKPTNVILISTHHSWWFVSRTLFHIWKLQRTGGCAVDIWK